jgi:hypothetical protein
MDIFNYLKWKRKYNKIKKLYEEEKANNELIMQEVQVLKTALRKATQEKNKFKNELKKYEKCIDK